MKLTVISFNCMGLFSFDTFRGFLLSTNIFQRINKIGELLAKESADIIMLQEVHTYLILTLLKMKLPTFPHVAYKHYIYGPRGGLVIFSKYPIEETEYSNYKKRGSFLNKSFVAHVIQNGILSCTLKNKSLTVLNTYITPNMDYDYSKSNRYARYSEAQLRQLATTTQRYKAKGSILIGGDFNADKKSYLYKLFVAQSKATDLFANDDIPTQHQEYYPHSNKLQESIICFFSQKRNLQYCPQSIFFTQKVRLKNEKATYLSDHIGLKATVLI